jgi:hypothetical protein
MAPSSNCRAPTPCASGLARAFAVGNSRNNKRCKRRNHLTATGSQMSTIDLVCYNTIMNNQARQGRSARPLEEVGDAWENARQLRERIAARRGGRPLPSSVGVIRKIRQERNAVV